MADYVIQPGDTLGALARRYGTTVQALAQANGIADPNRIRAGATIQVPGAPASAPRAPSSPAPTTGAVPVQRPASVAARDPMAAPMPRPRSGAQTAAAPAGSGMGSYNQPVQTNFAAPVAPQGPQQISAPHPGQFTTGALTPVAAPNQPRDQWQGPQGDAYAAQTQRRGRTTLTNNDIPDFSNMTLEDMSRFEQAWMAAGRDPNELPPQWHEARRIRRDQLEMERQWVMRDIARQEDEQRAQFRLTNGTDPRTNPAPAPTPQNQPSIGEGEYLPNEMIALGQLGANMQNAPQANTLLPSLGLLLPNGGAGPTLGQLARRVPPQRPPFTGYGA